MYRREIGGFDKAAKPACQCVRVHRCSVLRNKYSLSFLPRLPHLQESDPLPCAVLLQGVNRRGGGFNDPVAGFGFRFGCKYAHIREVLGCPLNGNSVMIKINIAPHQPHQFASAHTCKQQDGDGGTVVNRLILQQLQKMNCLFVIQIDRLCCLCLRRFCPLCNIGRDILPFYGGLQNNRNQPVIVENGLAGKGFRFSRRLKYFVKVDV